MNKSELQRAKKKQRFTVGLLAETYKVVIVWGGPKEVYDALYAWDYEEDEITKEGVEASWTNGHFGMTFSSPQRYPVIALHKPVGNNPVDIGTLAHEAVHAVKSFFDHLNTSVNDETEELFSQFVGAVVRQTLFTFAEIRKL